MAESLVHDPEQFGSLSVWAELAGQPDAVDQLMQAARHREGGVYHAWLLTGPPGSGRSNLAHAFAAALLCDDFGCGDCQVCRLVQSHNHPDVTVLATERVTITIEEVRQLVEQSHLTSAISRYRILIIEDADRMAERTSNVLLKALEEPPTNTIWILCAPSEADLLPTIRSRVRRVALKVPSVHDVARLLVERDGVEPSLAAIAAAEAQSHIGMAKRLATDSEARARRRDTLVTALQLKGLSSAMFTAERWLEIAKKDAEALTELRDQQERDQLAQDLGLAPGEQIPASLRTEFKHLEEAQKRRATRSLRDGLDRILVDLLSLYRDVLTVQLGANVPLVNEDLREKISVLAQASLPADTIAKLDSISVARNRIDANVRDLMVLEALAVQLMQRG